MLLWERVYSSGTNSTDWAGALAVDRTGNVIVTGTSLNGPSFNLTNFVSCTAKYAALDGALLWERRRPGGWGKAVAVDRANDVIVAGDSVSGAHYDYYTAKLAAATGAVMWQKQYAGFPSQDDYTSRRSLAISGDGVIALTGSSDSELSPARSHDFATIVYRENLPPISIERLSSAVRIRFAAIPDRVYHLQRAGDINGPWTTLSTETAPANGMSEYLDDNPLSGPAFYRVRED